MAVAVGRGVESMHCGLRFDPASRLGPVASGRRAALPRPRRRAAALWFKRAISEALKPSRLFPTLQRRPVPRGNARSHVCGDQTAWSPAGPFQSPSPALAAPGLCCSERRKGSWGRWDGVAWIPPAPAWRPTAVAARVVLFHHTLPVCSCDDDVPTSSPTRPPRA